MSSVDDRIVNMQFNNKQFTQGVTQSTKSLADLEKTLANTGKGGGLDKMGQSAEKVTGHFSAMRIAGISAIATIASKATLAGLQLAKSLTIGPLMQGFHEYETNLNSIQTILANTGLKGKAGLATVNKALAELNRYSDQTIYNFSQMASAIGRFTAAGVKLGPATAAIKGMANVAALTGASAEDLNRAMYQTSQALSAGTIKLMDWRSLENANMGTSNVRKALMETAKSMDDNGAAMEAAMDKMGNFRDSLSEGWLSSEIFTKTMKVMAGTTNEAGKTVAYTTEQLKKMGYSDAAAQKLHDLSQASIDSATKIKTFSQMVDVIKESIGSGWAKIFQDLFGNFSEATKLWTSVGTSITNTIQNIFGGVDKMLLGWKKLGGYQELWTAFGNIFQTIGNLFHPLIAMFQAIAPSSGQAGKGLYSLTHGFLLLTEGMEKASGWLSDILTPAFVAVGSIIRVLFGQVGKLASVFALLAPVFNAVGDSVSGMVQQGMAIASGLISGIVAGLNPGAIMAAMQNLAINIINSIKAALGISSPAATMVPVGVAIIEGIIQGIAYTVPKIFDAIGFLVSNIFDAIGSLFKGVDATELASLLNIVLTGALLITMNRIGGFIKNFTGIGASIRGTFDQLTDTLKTMQQQVRAKILLDIAISVGILTASLVALSLLDPKKMAAGLGGITVLLADVVGVLFAMSKIQKGGGLSIAGLAASLLLIAAAMIELGAAVTIFSKLSVNELAKGITGMAVSLGVMVVALKGLSTIPPGAVAGLAGSIFVLSAAMVVLSAAVLAFGNMQMDTLVKGIGAMGIALGILVLAMMGLGKMKGQAEGAAASIFIISAAMVVLSAAVLAFGNMDFETLAKGFGSVAIALSLFVVATLALSANAGGTLAAASSIAILAAAMTMLVPVILALGNMSMETLVKGIGALAITLGVFVVALTALAAVAYVAGPALLILGGALALIGIGMAAFGTGFALLAATGTAGIAVMTAAITAFVMLLPSIAQQMALAFIAFIKVIANATGPIGAAFSKIFANMLKVISNAIPQIVALVVKFIGELLKGITKLVPQFGKLISQMITTGLNILRQAVPQMASAGAAIILGVLKGIASKIGGIVKAATDIVVNFLRAIGQNAGRIADAGFKMIIDFLDGLTRAINNNVDKMRTAGLNLAMAIINGMTGGLLSRGLSMVRSAAESLANALPGWMKKVLGINSPARTMIPIGVGVGEGLAKGIINSIGLAVAAATRLVNAVLAEGNKAVKQALNAASAEQNKAYEAQARADLLDKEAKEAEAYANKHKKDKKAQQRAKEARKKADAAQKEADKKQKEADRAAQKAQDVEAWQEADNQGKADIKQQQAESLEEKASKLLAKSKAEERRARELMKTDPKAGRALMAQAKKDAKEAERLAKRSKQRLKEANRYRSKDVQANIKEREREIAQEKADAEYEKADNQGKIDILEERAKANEAKAERKKAEAAKFLALAKKWAKKDAKKAQRYLDRANAAADAAKEAADAAEQDRSEIESLKSESSSGGEDTGGGGDTGETGGGGGGGGETYTTSSGAVIKISRAILEDAAKAIDRYTASVLQAEQYAAAQASVVQYTQNNYSPEALSTSEIYRQSKNLLSTAEVKMAAPTPS